MKHIEQAPRGQAFTAGDLQNILDGMHPRTVVKVGVRFNGRPYRVEWDDLLLPDQGRPEAIRADAGTEVELIPFDQCKTPAPRHEDDRPKIGGPTDLPEGTRHGHLVAQGGYWRNVAHADPRRPWDRPTEGDR